MAVSTRRKIVLKGDMPYYSAVVAAGNTITPGMLIDFNASGEAIVHATANGLTEAAFAVERRWLGEDIDDTIGAGEYIEYVRPRSGDEINAFLIDEGNVDPTDPLTSDGAGALQAATVEVGQQIVGYPTEAVNNVGGPGPVRMSVRIR